LIEGFILNIRSIYKSSKKDEKVIYTGDFSIETTREFALELFSTKGGYG